MPYTRFVCVHFACFGTMSKTCSENLSKIVEKRHFMQNERKRMEQ